MDNASLAVTIETREKIFRNKKRTFLGLIV